MKAEVMRPQAAMAQETLFPRRTHPLKLLIVDKEPAVRSEFNELCRRVTNLQVLGEAESGLAAINAIESLSPDVMLIAVTLPDMSGFDVLRAVADGPRPLGIMTSHQSGHAVRAFAEGAVDYLLKPVSAERFVNAIGRARQHHGFDEVPHARLTNPLSEPASRLPKYLVGERQRRLYPLAVDVIDYIEADCNYVTIRVGETEYISRDSLKRLSSALGDFGFIRIDRSILLNVRSVRFAEPIGHGILAFTLASGVCLHSSRSCREAILKVLPWHHCRGGAGDEPT